MLCCGLFLQTFAQDEDIIDPDLGDVYDALDDAQDLVNLIIGVFAGLQVLGLCITVIMFCKLKAEDEQLPPEQQCLTGGIVCFYVCLFLCCGCIGTLIFYCVANGEIRNRKVQVFGQNNPGGVPVTTGYDDW